MNYTFLNLLVSLCLSCTHAHTHKGQKHAVKNNKIKSALQKDSTEFHDGWGQRAGFRNRPASQWYALLGSLHALSAHPHCHTSKGNRKPFLQRTGTFEGLWLWVTHNSKRRLRGYLFSRTWRALFEVKFSACKCPSALVWNPADMFLWCVPLYDESGGICMAVVQYHFHYIFIY